MNITQIIKLLAKEVHQVDLIAKDEQGDYPVWIKIITSTHYEFWFDDPKGSNGSYTVSADGLISYFKDNKFEVVRQS